MFCAHALVQTPWFGAWFGLCVNDSFLPLPSRPRSPEGLSSHDALEPSTPPNLCGIDHEALNKQIMEYKRRKEKGLLPCMSLAQPSGQEPVPDVTHLLRRRKKTSSRRHQDTSPRSFSLGEEEDEDEDEDEDSTAEYECQALEEEEEWEAEARSDGVQHGLHGQREQGQG